MKKTKSGLKKFIPWVAVLSYIAFILFYCFVALAACSDCRVSERGLNLIRIFEGFSPVAYRDSGGLWTIGYGHLIKPGEVFAQPVVGQAAEQLLMADIQPMERAINRMVIIDLHQNQFDALGSWTFNLGTGRLASSTLLRMVNERLHKDAAEQFNRWILVNGKPVRGLIIRRAKESKLYLEE